MKVVILCGGQGTRIRDVSSSVPKPMLTIGDFPILWHIMKYYASWGHNEFILCLGYKGSVIKDFFLNYEAYVNDFTISFGRNKSIKYHKEPAESDWQVTLAETGQDTLTGSRVRKIKKYLAGEENFMLTYGDGLGDVDLKKLEDFHLSHGKTLSVTGVRPPGRFGELENDASGLVKEFNEKPQTSGGRISGGFFICRSAFLDYLDEDKNQMFEQEPMRDLVRKKELMVFEHDGFWQCMDTYRDYNMLNSIWQQNKAPWKRGR